MSHLVNKKAKITFLKKGKRKIEKGEYKGDKNIRNKRTWHMLTDNKFKNLKLKTLCLFQVFESLRGLSSRPPGSHNEVTESSLEIALPRHSN